MSGGVSGGLEEAVRAEVERHHRVLQDWLGGGPGDLAAFGAAHAPAFTLAGPDGTVLRLEEVLDQVRAARGTAPGLRVTIRDVRLVAHADGLLVAAYEEWHHRPGGGAGRGRRATAALLREPALRWLHLQETWLPR
uniref:DUF4440 domain-containing protein n=1 Tax=Nonomuraea pusilla TaxID=46177 RepID=UPI0006E36720|nr:DUF4440 domain-containing protein [Nonomuraea pusilla]